MAWWPEAAARSSTAPTTCSPPRTRRCFVLENRERAAVSVRAPRPAGQLARSPLRRSMCGETIEGGPTLEILGVASVGRNRLTPQPRLNDRYELLDTVSLFRGNHQWRAGFDFNYVNHNARRCRCTSADGIIFQSLPANSGYLARAGHRHPGSRPRTAGRLHPRLRQSSAPYGYRTCHCSRRMTGASRPRLTLKLGRSVSDAVLAGHRVHDARGVDAVCRSGRPQQRRPARRSLVGRHGRFEDARAWRLTASTSTTSSQALPASRTSSMGRRACEPLSPASPPRSPPGTPRGISCRSRRRFPVSSSHSIRG